MEPSDYKRDPKTKALLNSNQIEYQAYLNRKNREKDVFVEINKLNNKIDELTSLIHDLLNSR